MNIIDIDVACERIGVYPPYFAFTRLEQLCNGVVVGEFVPEQPLGNEFGPVAVSEVGRHLAILGACAAVATQRDHHAHYLATHATYIHLQTPTINKYAESFAAEATIIHQDNRSLVANMILKSEVPCACLRVEYLTMSDALFGRLFKDYRVPGSISVASSPYRELIPLDFENQRGHALTAHSHGLLAEQCAGHFPAYPAWPVAIVAHSSMQVMGRLLCSILDADVTYLVTNVELRALRLAMAREPLTFQVDWMRKADDVSGHYFTSKVLCQNEIIATLNVRCEIPRER